MIQINNLSGDLIYSDEDKYKIYKDTRQYFTYNFIPQFFVENKIDKGNNILLIINEIIIYSYIDPFISFKLDDIINDINNIKLIIRTYLLEEYKHDISYLYIVTDLFFKLSHNYLHDEMYSDHYLIMNIINDYSNLLLDENLIIAIIKQKPTILRCIYNIKDNSDKYILIKNYLNNEKIVIEAIKKNIDMYEYISNNLKKNLNIINIATNINGYILKFLSYEFKNNKNIVLNCIKTNFNAIQFASNKIKNDEEFILKLIDYNPSIIMYISTNLKNYNNIVSCALKKDITVINYISDELINNVDFLLNIILFYKENKYIINYILQSIPKNISPQLSTFNVKKKIEKII